MADKARILAAAHQRDRKSFFTGILVILAIYLALTLFFFVSQDRNLNSLWIGPMVAMRIFPIGTALLIAAVSAQVTAGWFRPNRVLSVSTYMSASLLAVIMFMMNGLGRCGGG